jgi:hypothetical protein
MSFGHERPGRAAYTAAGIDREATRLRPRGEERRNRETAEQTLHQTGAMAADRQTDSIINT